MVDIILELIIAVNSAAIFVYLLISGRQEDIREQAGWRCILSGFALTMFGAFLDVTDNFPALSKFIFIGDTQVQSILATVVGYLGGALFLAAGFWQWLPTVIKLKKTEGELEKTHGELEMQVHQINRMAYHDFLTGLPNRRMFKETLETALDRNRRTGEKLAIVFVDLDHFKRINDSMGHQAGDKLLQEFSGRLQNQVRSSDFLVRSQSRDHAETVARFGGDEFIMILPYLKDSRDGARVARRVLDSLHLPFIIENHEIYVSASVGISIFPEDGQDVETLVKNADVAMYHAKENGRNNFQYYSSSMNQATLERLKLETQLRQALERDELELHYQPLVNVDTLKITGVEALIRWPHAEMGMVPPELLISIAEESGLILPIGEWVLRTACMQNREWQDQGFEVVVSVNISSFQFKVSHLSSLVLETIAEAGIEPECLDLELTESSIMQDEEVVIRILKALKHAGVKISLDDFGTGYSSLSYLRRLPIDTLKVDQSFLRDITTDPKDAEILNIIISLARCLELEVVAEGVESRDQFEHLKAAGCQTAQGFYLSYPLTADGITVLLAEGVHLESISS